jgi:ABC-type multidrug transport system ATPase subunit
MAHLWRSQIMYRQLDFVGIIINAAALHYGGDTLILVAAVAPLIAIIHHATNAHRTLDTGVIDTTKLEEFWEANKQNIGNHYLQRALPVALEVKSVVIEFASRGKITFSLRGGGFTIPSGARVLITGRYGAGKSLLLKGLIGLVPGVTLEGQGQFAESFTESWIYYPQTMTALIPFSEVTVAQLFRGCDCPTIAAAARVAGAVRLMEQNELTGTMSGGERSAAALATRLAMVRPQSWLATDECTTGMDPAQGYAVYSRMFEAYPDTTIFVITHLERIEEMCGFTHILDISEGVVTMRGTTTKRP